ncbi:P27 family phage terminase small subunit [Citricoccus nitrophenolicus]|uniref:P27 family phage terminase small subunit n=1 Tax=Citricoccus nitrophenolicus TaxID=863575 RepID=UPI0031E98F72
MTAPRTPRGLEAAGKALWSNTVADFELSNVELAGLEEACRTRDRIKELDAAVTKDGLMITSSQGLRLHPAVAESRQQRLALARLLATLAIPGLEEDDLPASRGVRGVYAGKNTFKVVRGGA